MALTKFLSDKKHDKKNAKKAQAAVREVAMPEVAPVAAPAPEYVAALSDLHTDSANIGESIHDHDDLQKKAKDHSGCTSPVNR
jgi:hypothetical protein